MHGVLWAHCAHGARLPFRAVRAEASVFTIVRSVSAGGYSRSQEAAGGDPVGGSPTNSKNE